MSVHLAAAEWRRGQESLGAARLCLSGAFYADSVSLSYYSVLHAAKAMLQLHGFSARSHAGIRGVFGLHIVNAGLVERRWGAVIGQLGALSEVADYQVTAEVDETDGREACERADAFLNRIRPLLPRSIPPKDLEENSSTGP